MHYCRRSCTADHIVKFILVGLPRRNKTLQNCLCLMLSIQQFDSEHFFKLIDKLNFKVKKRSCQILFVLFKVLHFTNTTFAIIKARTEHSRKNGNSVSRALSNNTCLQKRAKLDIMSTSIPTQVY